MPSGRGRHPLPLAQQGSSSPAFPTPAPPPHTPESQGRQGAWLPAPGPGGSRVLPRPDSQPCH